MLIDYTADAPDFTAWAGNGPLAEEVRSSGRELLTELRADFNRVVNDQVAAGATPADAMAGVDVESLARQVLTGLFFEQAKAVAEEVDPALLRTVRGRVSRFQLEF